MSQADDDNHADQLNENNDAYWQSRGHEERPQSNNTSDDEWEDYQEFNDIKSDS